MLNNTPSAKGAWPTCAAVQALALQYLAAARAVIGSLADRLGSPLCICMSKACSTIYNIINF